MAKSSVFNINGINYEVLDAETKATLDSLIAGTLNTNSGVTNEKYWVPDTTYKSAIDAILDISGKAERAELVTGINAFTAVPQWDTEAADPTQEPNYGIYTIHFPVASINSSTGAVEFN